MYKLLARILGTVLLTATYYHDYEHLGRLHLAGGGLVLLVYALLIWAPKRWRTEAVYFTASLMIIAVDILLYSIYGSLHPSLIWPLFFMIVFMTHDYRRINIAIGLLVLGVIFVIYSLSFTTVMGLLGAFLLARNSKIRRDTHQLTRQHLEELNRVHQELEAAHNELHEANMYSVRYAALEERTRLAREIHDGLGHQLTSLIIQLQALKIMQATDPARAAEAVEQLTDIARQAMEEVRIAVKEWSNDEMGLGSVALKGLISQTRGRTPVQLNFSQHSEGSEWSIETSIILYRVLQESLTNVLRHTDATIVDVELEEMNDTICLTVTDNGTTAGGEQVNMGFGLKGIAERCKAGGGSCTFSAVEPHGFRVQVILPVEAAALEEMQGEQRWEK
ncbi:sensor histidine kinase [Paenibacillus sp. FSL R7-0273]|uniref:sensor histidine kinase n=1 Tax=Paenibacillus sp. FSL R7-0273 TaxID=1536772 RepID=UPI001E639839|nr:sensor histidine kinase [Paenibacillus sp. FSL R7-0273]